MRRVREPDFDVDGLEKVGYAVLVFEDLVEYDTFPEAGGEYICTVGIKSGSYS